MLFLPGQWIYNSAMNFSKRILFPVLLLLLIFLAIEGASFAALSLARGRFFSFAEADHARRIAAENRISFYPGSVLIPEWMKADTLHPYVGFVLAPPTPADPYGFQNSVSPIQKKSPEKVIVGILGGSVAGQVFDWGEEALLGELRRAPSFRGKEIVMIRLAAGGYKQPQQLMIVNYLLMLGAEFDVLINIDGFNEISLPFVENIPKNVFPAYPRLWYMRVGTLSTSELMGHVGKITILKGMKSRWAAFFSRFPFRDSSAFYIVWKAGDTLIDRFLYNENSAVLDYKPQKSNYAETGPLVHYEKESALYEDLAAIWERSSVLLNQLCRENGIRYFHFLQPNQYVAGSKVLTAKEKKECYDEHRRYSIPVIKGYRYLMSAGRDLSAKGIRFHDLTKLFVPEKGPVYADPMCHFNKRGCMILGSAIGKIILEEDEGG